MNEAASVLRQTNHERKVAGYGVHHKKGGSAVSKLGNKPMSWQEIQSKHGPVQTYSEGFTSYEDFKKMPPDLEVNYVNNLCAKYSIRHEDISTILFELSDLDLMARLKIKGVDKKLHTIKKSEVTDEARQIFKDDVNLWRDHTERAKIIDLSEAQRKHNIIENAEFISYETYRTFSDAEKLNYVNNLVDRYDVGQSIISKVLFSKSESTLDQYFYTKNLKSSLHMTKPCAPDARKEKTKVFTDAVNAWRGESVVEETVPEQPKNVARDIIAAIIGEEPEKETPIIESIKPELPESNISAVYIPVEQETVEMPVTESLETVADDESFVEQPDIPTKETLDKQIEDLNKKLALEPIIGVDDIFKQVGIPKINFDFTAPIIKETPKPSSEVYFSTRYISEKGLDREQILNKIYLLASLFENEENLEITLTVATKKKA